MPVVVSCFVFALRRRPRLTLDPEEVRDAFWFPLEDLLDPERRRTKTFRFLGRESTFPAMKLLGEGRPWLWGITYRLISQLLTAVGHPL